jgi:protein-disulfide isomerase
MSELKTPVGPEDHVQGGPEDAPITLVEYGDYQCPHCARAHPIVKTVQEALGENLRFVFRNFPLSSLHEDAENAAEAAEIAGESGKFWEMHDTLFEHQRSLGEESLVEYAVSLGLDEQIFLNDLTAHTYNGRIRRDFIGGAKSGVNGTPTFFINGSRYDGAWDHGGLLRFLRNEYGL